MTRRFDVFLRHGGMDALWTERLATDLERYEVSVLPDETRHQADHQPEALEHGLDTCGAMVLVVSPEALASGWVAETHARALALAQRKDAALHLIPVLRHGVELPAFLAQRSWVEFREPDGYADGVWHVVWGITGEKPARLLALEPPAAVTPSRRAGTAPGKRAAIPAPGRTRVASRARSRRAITQR